MAIVMPTNALNTSVPTPKINSLTPVGFGGTLLYPERWTTLFRSPTIRFGGSTPGTVPNGTNMKPPKPLPGSGGGGGGAVTVGYAT